jgi:hypothetical protein
VPTLGRSKVSSDSFSFESRTRSPTPQLFAHDAAAGSRRANDIITLTDDDRIHVNVATQDSGGALFMTEQPIERRGAGPPIDGRDVLARRIKLATP